MMARDALELILPVIQSRHIKTLDLTGGAPELHSDFRYLVAEVRAAGVHVIDRCNLTILFEPKQEDLAEFLANSQVEVIASLPCYSLDNVDKQRNKGVLDKSIAGLQKLNALGYGEEKSGLKLNLVYNPQGASLPPDQTTVTGDYKRELRDHFGIGFNQLHALANMPIKRFGSVTTPQFDSLPKHEQLAFLINAYNAWTVELILSAWPDLKSIKDLGGNFSAPWSKNFVTQLGKTRSLDDIEHKLIRGCGRYNDPRVHFAVNCANIGCPALRSEAYTGNRLDKQLNEQTSLLLRDRSRNRVEANVIELSSIFKWYREDFEKGWLGYRRLEDFLTAHANALQLSDPTVSKFKLGDADIEFLDYDWRLNSKP